MTMEIRDFLKAITEDAQKGFRKARFVLSFEEYLNLVIKNPDLHIRNSAQYFCHMIDKLGSYEVSTPAGKKTRYNLFDAEFANAEGKIFGHETVQQKLITHFKNFARCGRTTKLVMLHGPNGSAKTSIVQALNQAAEFYSKSDEGAIYHFVWIFPKKAGAYSSMGFSNEVINSKTSYAELTEDEIGLRISSEEKDHPLLLLSLDERKQLFEELKKDNKNLVIPHNLRVSELSHKNKQIYDALLSAYNGDLNQVLRHVRIERYFLSRRYRKSLSVVEPQMSVDAMARQITQDQSLAMLPGSLRHLSLYEVMGPLAEANRGLIEYSDLLKRPIDSFKYLLVACEQSEVSLGSLSLFFDLLMVATSNELHLASFKEYPDWQSFKGRIELIRVPYLLRTNEEEGIYKNQIPKALANFHIAPHCIEMAARWAVLTRLEPPHGENYSDELKDIIRSLSPEEKLELYNNGSAPEHLSQQKARKLKSCIRDLFNEHANLSNYEGRYGASPREIISILLHAAQDARYNHLAVTAMFDNIEELIKEHSTYEFLRRETVNGYRDASQLLLAVKNRYVQILKEEMQSALGLIPKESYEKYFSRYVLHVSAWTKNERVIDPLLQREVEPDQNLMTEVESKLLAQNESNKDFRNQLIADIAAYRLEHEDDEISYDSVFKNHIKKLKESSYEQQKPLINRILNSYMKISVKDKTGLSDKDISYALSLREGLIKRGYNDESAACAMNYLLRHLE